MVRFSGGRCVLAGTDFDAWLTAEIPARGDDFSFVFHRTANAVGRTLTVMVEKVIFRTVLSPRARML